MINENSLKNLKRFSSTNQPTGKRSSRGTYLIPLLKKLLEKTIKYQDPETLKMVQGKVKDAVLWRLILNATEGETHAIKEILDRIEGKTIQVIETPNIPTIQLFVTNILEKAGIDDAKRETTKSDSQG